MPIVNGSNPNWNPGPAHAKRQKHLVHHILGLESLAKHPRWCENASAISRHKYARMNSSEILTELFEFLPRDRLIGLAVKNPGSIRLRISAATFFFFADLPIDKIHDLGMIEVQNTISPRGASSLRIRSRPPRDPAPLKKT